jgi:two-component system nitrate/nitrite response regulator NarL
MAQVKVKVGIVADVRVFREGLARLLRSVPWVQIAALGGVELLGHRRSTDACDVLLIEAGSLLARNPGVRAPDGTRLVAIGTRPENLEGVMRCAEAGAFMFLHADATIEEIVNAIGIKGRRSSEFLALDHRADSAEGTPSGQPPILTPREREIVELIADRLSNRQIAVRLQIDVSTVKNHVHSILRKLRVRRRTEAALLTRDFANGTTGAATAAQDVWLLR